MISLTNVEKKYNDEVSIGPVNLDIKEGGINSIIGPNGAGKSTLLMMIGRLLPKDCGKISIGGLDIDDTDSNKMAKTVSILKQENNFISKLTVKQLISFGRFPYSQGRLTEEDIKIIDKYIDFFELRGLEDRYLDELSGGQRQRAYVAMVLAQETKYVLLDEPLNNLDVARSISMMKHLRKACDALNKTFVLVIHDINIAAQYSDRIFAMKNGKLICEGSVDEVMDGKRLSKIFDTSINIVNGPYGKIAVYN
ncbi:ABC transporter ATP-binding protein [Anaerococcus sp. ENR1011]|uniref:ABC transporter ATP-binding protein n=1 Tax=Anaerococcus groningensis TaxID=3115616 RepID=A0ABW9MYL8_9FIRM